MNCRKFKENPEKTNEFVAEESSVLMANVEIITELDCNLC